MAALKDTLTTSGVEEMAAVRKQRFESEGLFVWLGGKTYEMGLELG